MLCVAPVLSPPPPHTQGHTVTTFAAERAAYVTFGFLKSLYGARYRAPKNHSTRCVAVQSIDQGWVPVPPLKAPLPSSLFD
jgi:hypothetical protein